MSTLHMTRPNETLLDAFRPGYANTFIEYHADKFGWTPDYARAVTCDAIRFLSLCAVPIGQAESPEAQVMVSSPIVDQIVDAIFLDTCLLRWLEARIWGVRMVHTPSYAHGVIDPGINDARYEFTVTMMRAAGYPIAMDIWPARLPVGYATCTNGNDLEDCAVMADHGYDGT